MFYYLFVLLMGLVCPSDTPVNKGEEVVYTTNDGGGTGGDTRQVPPRPPRR